MAAAVGVAPAVIDEVALVVGHTDTLPAISAGLGGPTIPQIGAAEFDHLFVQGRGRLAHFRYGA